MGGGQTNRNWSYSQHLIPNQAPTPTPTPQPTRPLRLLRLEKLACLIIKRLKQTNGNLRPSSPAPRTIAASANQPTHRERYVVPHPVSQRRRRPVSHSTWSDHARYPTPTAATTTAAVPSATATTTQATATVERGNGRHRASIGSSRSQKRAMRGERGTSSRPPRPATTSADASAAAMVAAVDIVPAVFPPAELVRSQGGAVGLHAGDATTAASLKRRRRQLPLLLLLLQLRIIVLELVLTARTRARTTPNITSAVFPGVKAGGMAAATTSTGVPRVPTSVSTRERVSRGADDALAVGAVQAGVSRLGRRVVAGVVTTSESGGTFRADHAWNATSALHSLPQVGLLW